MQMIEINSHRISHVFYQHHLLTVVLQTGERFLYRLLESTTFAKFMDSTDKDKFYKTEIEANKEFKRIRILG
ncbi:MULTISPECIES: hypothetical protein [Acinetobacter]|uniref:hypothetical protein n=1 Tax=Acinetobacter TaxID=469 RepID=UPI0025809CFE|nr:MULTISPECIES: hypothetical protein [Acinetobacter]